MTHSMKINLNLIYKHSKMDQINVSLSVLCVQGYPGVSWGNKTDPNRALDKLYF